MRGDEAESLEAGEAKPAGQVLHEQYREERLRALRGWFGTELAGVSQMVLEIGCGHGHFLAAYASEHPHEVCVGVDLKTRRVEASRRKGRRRGLDNLWILKAEGVEFIRAMPQDLSISRLFLLYPDPWPKRRAHKNRILQAGFLSLLAQRMTVNGRLHFRTDHAEYFEWTRDHLRSHRDWEIDKSAEWPFEEKTFFEERTGRKQSLTACRRW